MHAFAKALFCAVVLFSVRTAKAEAPDCRARVEFLRHTLSREAARAEAWTSGWGAGLAVITAGQMAAIPWADREDRVDLYVGTASSAVGFIALMAAPLSVIKDGPAFAARTGEPCALAKEGERMLEEGAKSERMGTGVVAHTGNVLFNVGLGLLLGWGFGHWESGIVNMVVGTAVGEGLIVSQPTGLVSF
jgi:hypothetical protein